MCALSPLYVLPLHIVELILDYIAGSSRLQFDDVYKGTEEYATLLMPLLTACPSFASPAYARMFGVYDIKLFKVFDYDFSSPPLLQINLGNTLVPAHLHVKKLKISVAVLDIYRGTTLKELSCESYINCTFPKVRAIDYSLHLPSAHEHQEFIATSSPDTESNISAFVERVKQMAPLADSVIISTTSRNSSRPESIVYQLNNLVSQLSQCAININYGFDHRLVIFGHYPTGLRSLVYRRSGPTDDDDEHIMQLVRRNASTLMSLALYVTVMADITSLIQNADGSYVEYYYLHTFRLHEWQNSDKMTQRPVFPGAVPFPNLRRLEIRHANPFGDDTPFRGNAATLESLSLSPSTSTARILRDHNIFTPNSHPRLHYVSIEGRPYSRPNIFKTEVEYLRFVLSIGPNSPVRTILDSLKGTAPQSILSTFGEYTCIQVLNLENLHLDIWDTIALIKALPLLSDLHATFSVLGPRPDGVSEPELPAYLIANYAPMGKLFRCWCIEFETFELHVFREAVHCVLLLALACPNFDYAAVPRGEREVVMAYMNEMIATDAFKPHASRLRRLLFGGREDQILSVDVAQAEYEEERARWS
ncbi:hypothetical protein GGI09_000435 [Coemansia sp. S100]|nr:hypothetical protein LPJ71_000264 [Coemansia sp. S17]KAJ2103877.1 hypothetical protein GGI09_000435 [Coemansia sp. S100]